jgi:hypothetical protein
MAAGGRGCAARGGRDNNNNNGRGGRGGRSGNYRARSVKTGLTEELEGHIFDLGERESADLMRTTQIKIAQYIGTLYGGDIMGELETKTEFVAPSPKYPSSAVARQPNYEAMIRSQLNNELATLTRKVAHIQTQINITDPTDLNTLDTLEE